MSKTKDGDATGVTEHDDNYLGTSPEYQNSAYETTAPVVASDAGNEIEDRVREHVEAMAQPAPEARSFEDWVSERKAAREGTSTDDGDDGDDDPTKAELLEEARELEIDGRSSMKKDELAAAIEDAKQEPQS